MIFSENRFTPRIKCGAGFFRIMPYALSLSRAAARAIASVRYALRGAIRSLTSASTSGGALSGDPFDTKAALRLANDYIDLLLAQSAA